MFLVNILHHKYMKCMNSPQTSLFYYFIIFVVKGKSNLDIVDNFKFMTINHSSGFTK